MSRLDAGWRKRGWTTTWAVQEPKLAGMGTRLDPPVSVFEVLDFYEHIALLVKKGHLDLYDMWHTFYEWAQPVYVDLQLLIESADSAYADHYDDLQRMMRKMDEIQLKRMHSKNANHWALWTPDRIIEHYRYELESGGRPRRSRRAAAREMAREVAKEMQLAEQPERPDWPAGAAPPDEVEAHRAGNHA